MERYIAYIEETLHIFVNVSVYSPNDILPLYLRNSYDFYTMTVYNVKCLLARPKEATNLSVLRKQCVQLKKLTGLDCVLCLEGVRIYTKERMLSEGIPFVIVGQQIYMPFLGIVLTSNGMRDIPCPKRLSFISQKILLVAIYSGWKQITLSEAAKAIGVSKMSVSRCFNELQALGLLLVKSEGKMRRFIWEGNRRALWDTARPFLRNPVAQQYRFEKPFDIVSAKLGGMSALCHYSMLADNPYTVYAVSKDTAIKMEVGKHPQIPDDETPGMVIQIIRYDLEYHDVLSIDPLTAILSLSDEDMTDPRLEVAIERVLEDCLND